jgi:hypothetical protein
MWIAPAASVSVQAGDTEDAVRGEEEGGRRRARDEQEDHRVVKPLQPDPPRLAPVAAMVERADPKHRGHAGQEDGQRGDPQAAVRVGQHQGPDHKRGLEPDQVHPAPQQRFHRLDALHNRHSGLLVVLLVLRSRASRGGRPSALPAHAYASVCPVWRTDGHAPTHESLTFAGN